MKKRISHTIQGLFLVAATVGITFQAHAMTPAQELISLTDANTLNRTFDSLIPSYRQRSIQLVQQHTGHSQLTAKDLAVVDKLTQSMLSTSQDYLKRMNIMQSIEGVYATYYTDQEIQAYLRFLKSPEGRSIMSKRTQISGAIDQQIAMSITNIAKSASFQQTISQNIQRILAELPKK
ncbi:DUF2059 domain-containing protein [Acinetobacter apis]|uniref:DUF2059 domain-containing protein n=1 Tax=Acinetobacter apis TaxID=1229165 RepID=A0A217EG37_9GAMM|nr:DUF2059 domain-containing protein [Acinetobacter apis]SNQ29314.1 hypothetical protein SAMN05444584_1261 [Acinetobacter apis]